MSLLKGSASFSRFFAGAPEGGLKDVGKAIVARAFMPLSPLSDELTSTGWVTLEDPFSDVVSDDDQFYVFGNLIAVTFRSDSFKIPKHILKKETQKKVDAYVKEIENSKYVQKEDRTVSAAVRKQFSENALRELRARTIPSSKTIEVLWNTSSGEVFVFGQGPTVHESLAALFERTFGTALWFEDYPTQTKSAALPVRSQATLKALQAGSFLLPLIEASPVAEMPQTNGYLAEKQFLGQEFLTWLYFVFQSTDPLIPALNGEPLATGLGKKVNLRTLDPDKPRVGLSGADLNGNQELLVAVKRGALIDTLALDFALGHRDYSCTLKADGTIKSLVLPDMHTDPDEDLNTEGKMSKRRPKLPTEDPLALRASVFAEATGAIDHLFRTFLAVRLTDGWNSAVQKIRESLEF